MRGEKGSDDLPRHQSLSIYDTGDEVELLMLYEVKMSALLTDSDQGRTTLNTVETELPLALMYLIDFQNISLQILYMLDVMCPCERTKFH